MTEETDSGPGPTITDAISSPQISALQLYYPKQNDYGLIAAMSYPYVSSETKDVPLQHTTYRKQKHIKVGMLLEFHVTDDGEAVMAIKNPPIWKAPGVDIGHIATLAQVFEIIDAGYVSELLGNKSSIDSHQFLQGVYGVINLEMRRIHERVLAVRLPTSQLSLYYQYLRLQYRTRSDHQAKVITQFPVSNGYYRLTRENFLDRVFRDIAHHNIQLRLYNGEECQNYIVQDTNDMNQQGIFFKEPGVGEVPQLD